MKFTQAFLVASLVVCASALVILPEDFPQRNQMGQCPSGLPFDGTFESGALGDASLPNSWRVGAWRSGKSIDPASVAFQSGFTDFPSFFDIAQQQGSSGQPAQPSSSQFSLRLPGNGILFQYLNNIAYAHYRIRACARVHGETDCRVEVRNSANEIVDWLDFLPEKNITSSCQSQNPEQQQQRDCAAQCSTVDSTLSQASIRYTGAYPTTVMLRLPGEQSGMSIDLTPGQVFNITADLFPEGSDNSTGSSVNSTGLPQWIEIVEFPGQKKELIDVISTNCSSLTALPGMRFGDKRQFVMASAWDADMNALCGVSEVADKEQQCACESESVQERCLLSDKGFVALPHDEYYIGLVSKDCSCSFDNVCLDWVNGEEGYFGLDWLLVKNATATQ